MAGAIPGWRYLPAALLCAGTLLAPVGLSAQDPGCGSLVIPAQMSAEGLGEGPYACAGMLYERTIFNVDILELTLRFDGATALELAALQASQPDVRSEEARDEVVRRAIKADEVLVRTRIRRGIGLDQFLDGARESMALAVSAGLMPQSAADSATAGMSQLYAVFEGRGLREDDALWYRISGDELHIVMKAADGETLGDVRTRGPHIRSSILGGYLARGSDFRRPLLESLPDGGAAVQLEGEAG